MSTKKQISAALNEAIKKYDTPRRKRSKPCNGVKESDREIRSRINQLRNNLEETKS